MTLDINEQLPEQNAKNSDAISFNDPVDLSNVQHAIENDGDTLEPFIDEQEYRKIDADDPEQIKYWALQFQISEDDLKSAIVLNGNAVKEIKKYLSV